MGERADFAGIRFWFVEDEFKSKDDLLACKSRKRERERERERRKKERNRRRIVINCM